jgi:hypothetical protein
VFYNSLNSGNTLIISFHLIRHTDIKPIAGVSVEEFDNFHEFVICDELGRCGSGGVLWGLCGGKCLLYILYNSLFILNNKIVKKKEKFFF